MKTKHLLLLGMIAAFSSCSTAYRTGQTPDDVYFSPAPPAQESYVTSNNQDRNSYYRNDEEQEIRRGIQNPVYRSNIALDFGYGYNPYTYNSLGFNNSFYNPYAYNSFGSYGYKGIYDPYGYNPYSYGYNPYSFSPYGYSNFGYYGNSFYNPYYSGYYPPVYAYPGVGYINSNTGPRRVNLAAYNNTGNNRISRTAPSNQPSSVPVRSFNQSRQGTGVGNVIRRVFTPSESRTYTPSSSNNRTYNNENNNTRSNSAPVRSIDNSPSTNTNTNSSSSGSSGSAPVRTFRR